MLSSFKIPKQNTQSVQVRLCAQSIKVQGRMSNPEDLSVNAYTETYFPLKTQNIGEAILKKELKHYGNCERTASVLSIHIVRLLNFRSTVISILATSDQIFSM